MKKKISKFVNNPRTIDDPLVKDCLEALCVIEPMHYVLVGGMATQSYLPSSYRRATSDVDLSIIEALDDTKAKAILTPMGETFQEKGYTYEIHKGSRSYCLSVISPKEEGICIELSRRNEGNFAKNREKLEREYENARNKIIEGRNTAYKVCAPEDIALPKLVRLINSINLYPDLKGLFPANFDPISQELIERKLGKIAKLRKEAMTNPGDPELSIKLRTVSDLYDIRLLGEISGYNDQYWEMAAKSWDTISNNLEIKDEILSKIAPQLVRPSPQMLLSV